jgi:acetylglutamate kinase
MSWTKEKLYKKEFCGTVFVLKVSGEVINSLEIVENILLDVKKIAESGIEVIVVHGGGSQADELSKMFGHTPKKIGGRRITEEKDLKIAKMLYGGVLNMDILSIMKKIGLKGLRVSGLDGGLLDVVKRPVTNVDYGFVGDIQNVHPHILSYLLSQHYIPIISPLAVTNDGTIVNINADTIAMHIATTVRAKKLILFTKTDGVLDTNRNRIKTLDTDQAQEMIDTKVVTDGMSIKIQNCISVVKNGVERVHIINGLSPHSLLKEVFTKRGVGTMILSPQEKRKYETE